MKTTDTQSLRSIADLVDQRSEVDDQITEAVVKASCSTQVRVQSFNSPVLNTIHLPNQLRLNRPALVVEAGSTSTAATLDRLREAKRYEESASAERYTAVKDAISALRAERM